MKLHLHTSEQHQITGFDTTSIRVNQVQYFSSLVVSPETLLPDWFNQSWAHLDAQALQAVADLKPEVVLLGTGDKHRFIHPKHLQAFVQAHIAVECMSTAAACRTFNILTAEGRKVVAALLLEAGLEEK